MGTVLDAQWVIQSGASATTETIVIVLYLSCTTSRLVRVTQGLGYVIVEHLDLRQPAVD